MRKNKFETLLREAVLLDAEERGADAMRAPETEPVPAAARARFEKALANRRVPERETAAHRSAPRRTFARALVYLGASAVCLALVVLVVAAYFKSRSGRIEPLGPGSSAAPGAPATPTPSPIPARTQEPGGDPFAAITPHPTEDPFSAITPEPTAIPVPAATPHPTAPPDAAPTPTPTPEPGE